MENLKLYIIVLLANSKMRIIHARRPIAVHIIITTNKRINTVCSLPLQLNFISFENHLLEQVHYISCIFWWCSISGKHAPCHKLNSIRLQMLHLHQSPVLTVICQHNVVPASARIFSLRVLPCRFYLLHVINPMISPKVCFISWWFANSLGWGALSLFICLLAFLFCRDLHIYCFILYKPDLGSLRRFIIYIHVAKSWQ